MLLKRLPDVVDTNPAKVAFGIVKIIFQIKDVCLSFGHRRLTDSGCQEVKGNIDAVDQRIISTVNQLRAIEDARYGWKPNTDKELRAVKSFESTLIKEYGNLIKLKKQSIMRKIAVHEECKGEIAEIFQRINQAREQLVRSLLKDLQPAHSADHKYELEGKDQSLRRSVCTPGTRVRIRDDITKWANDTSSESSSVYWLVGQAGLGKTTIAHTIARRFEFAGDADDKIVLGGNFFCSRQMKETRSATRIVRTIAYHLARRCKAFADALDCTDFDIIHQGVRAQLQKLLIEPWRRVQSAESTQVPYFLVIIDALDEIDGQGGSEFLRDLLDSINKYGLRGLKFFATSRPDPGLVDHLESFPNKQFYHLQQVPMEEAEADITAYLNAELPNLQGTQELKNLVGQAAGLFIYAATVVKYLGKSSPPEQRGRIIRLPPSGIPQSRKDTSLLDRLYLQVLQDAFGSFEDDDIDLDRRLKIMHTFLCSAEPISINIVAKLLFSPEDSNFTETISDVLTSLHAVLYTQNHMVLSYHKSFTDFMFDQNRAERFWCDTPQFHLLLSNSCFRVMDIGLKFNIANIETSFILDQDNPALPNAVKENIPPVLRYSCFNWGYHLAETDSHKLVDTLSRFLKLPVLFWVEAMNLMGSRGLCERMLRDAHNRVGAIAISSDNRWIVSGSDDHTVRVWDASTGEELKVLEGHSNPVWSVAFSSDKKWIISGSGDQTVRVWDASTGEEMKVLEGHSDWVSSVAFSSNNKCIVSSSRDWTVRVWDTLTGEVLKVMEGHSDWVSSVAFSSDNKCIVSSSRDWTVQVWDTLTGEELKVLEGHNNWWIVSGSGDHTVRVWDTSTGEELKVLEGHSDSVSSVTFSSDNKWIISSSWDQTMKVLEGHSSSVSSAAFSSDNKWIISGSRDETVRVWDASTGEELKALEVAFSSDNKWIVSGSYDNTVRVWDVSTGEELKELEGHSNLVSSVAFTSDNKHIVSGSRDNTVQVSVSSVQHAFFQYVRQKSRASIHTGWLLSIGSDFHYLMFVPLAANLPDSSNILTIPQSRASSVDFMSASIGPEWSDCFSCM
ncbi:hypothetical protein BDN70DRAFT_819840 [Pholiota conissans]|uniref:Nephrocystin 3-like N-terminal domain-containing protein n=1 Tax=Pholiota conissans TaxID=109636 RepID=A0A9P5YN05_9AGAR|nr:hypothetical protein BDN70DRAFT_819840 [Pholiota conissans]